MTLLEQLTITRPRTPAQLHAWVRLMLRLDVPRRAVEPGNDAPFDYLCHAFFEDTRDLRDCCVWANRGGGKTMLAAVATLLDLLFKPGIKVCLLGGSFEQAARMHEHLAAFFEREPFVGHIKRLTRDRLELRNGSTAHVLSQSHTSVRGWHVHRLRCDEVELFETDLWEAAQLTTRSGWCGDVFVRAGIEAFSTMHRAGGLMNALVERSARRGEAVPITPVNADGETSQASEAAGDFASSSDADAEPRSIEDLHEPVHDDDAPMNAAEESKKPFRVRGRPRFISRPFVPTAVAAGDFADRGAMARLKVNADRALIAPALSFPTLARRLFRWGVLETLERCGPERSCASCVLFEECQGRAKSPEQRGFVAIDDVTIQKQRISRPAWESEMLCRRPSMRDAVYAEFDPAVHVIGAADDPPEPWTAASDSDAASALPPIVLGGIDFGYRAPTVIVLARYNPLTDQLLIFDELKHTEHIASRFVREFERRLRRHGTPRPRWIGADPAGHQRNEHTGESTVAVWKRAGFSMRTRRFGLEAGLDAVRARLRAADGSVRLRLHARCGTLIAALREYRYPAGDPDAAALSEAPPLKNGPDHAADALRYLVINLDRGLMGGFRWRGW